MPKKGNKHINFLHPTQTKQFGRRSSPTILRIIRALKRPITLGTFTTIFIVSIFYYYTPIHNLFNNTINQLSDRLGLTVQNIYLSGQNYTPLTQITSSLGVKLGDQTFRVPLKTIKNKLENIGWIDEAIIFRQLPDSIYVSIIEKKPAALWQTNKKLYLIDENGNIITDEQLKSFANFIIIVGDDAPLYVKSLLTMLKKDLDLYSKIIAAIRIGERRWNIRLANGLEVKLPETLTDEAWEYIIKLYKQKNLFVPGVMSIDLRIQDKLYVK